MSKLNWIGIKQLKDSDSIESFEKEYGINLPEELKGYIIQYNGGSPNLDVLKTAKGKEVQIKLLLSYNKDDIETIYKCINYFKDNYNNQLLPFASEDSGDYFCINIKTKEVILWHHEGDVIETVSSSLEEFFDNLYEI